MSLLKQSPSGQRKRRRLFYGVKTTQIEFESRFLLRFCERSDLVHCLLNVFGSSGLSLGAVNIAQYLPLHGDTLRLENLNPGS